MSISSKVNPMKIVSRLPGHHSSHLSGCRSSHYQSMSDRAAMDHAHHKFTALLGALPLISQTAFPCLLNSLVMEAQDHFEQEERFMMATRYERHDAHKAQHQLLLDKLTGFQKALEQGKRVEPFEVQMVICEWQDQHQHNWDYPLADFLRQRASWEALSA